MSAAPPAGAVLVTGASTGIGRAAAERLARAGTPVLAGVRKDADAQALGAIPGVEPVILDVTNADHIAALAERASSMLLERVALFGVSVSGPVPEERFKKLAANLKATMIVQHDQRDIDKLPAFPTAAR